MAGGAPPPPLFLDQIEARRAEKKFGGGPVFPLSKGLDDRPPPLISRSGSGTAHGFVLPIREGYFMLVTYLSPYHPSLSLSDLNLDTCVNCLRE